jgi:hypothetical protein
METKTTLCARIRNRLLRPAPLLRALNRKGQALVEFTLIFVLLLVIIWIPADFGLAFMTGQLASNAAREGARIGAADPNVAGQLGSCTLPGCYSLAEGTLRKEIADRLSSALLPGATVTVSMTGSASTCTAFVNVSITGNYNFWFYRILNLFGFDIPPTSPINRSTAMRWEHQC